MRSGASSSNRDRECRRPGTGRKLCLRVVWSADTRLGVRRPGAASSSSSSSCSSSSSSSSSSCFLLTGRGQNATTGRSPTASRFILLLRSSLAASVSICFYSIFTFRRRSLRTSRSGGRRPGNECIFHALHGSAEAGNPPDTPLLTADVNSFSSSKIWSAVTWHRGSSPPGDRSLVAPRGSSLWTAGACSRFFFFFFFFFFLFLFLLFPQPSWPKRHDRSSDRPASALLVTEVNSCSSS